MESKSVRIDVLPIVGATVCLISLCFFSWESDYLGMETLSILTSDFLLTITLIVLVGTLLSYVNSIGGIVICCGMLLYYLNATIPGVLFSYPSYSNFHPYSNYMAPLMIGPLLALSSGVIIVIGIFRPIILRVPLRFDRLRFRILSIMPCTIGQNDKLSGLSLRRRMMSIHLSKEHRAALRDSEPSPRLDSEDSCKSTRVDLNILCLLGAAIAIFSIFLPWIDTSATQMHSLISISNIAPSDLLLIQYYFADVIDEQVVVFFIVFMIGAIVSILSPLGGIIQLSGLSGFAIIMLNDTDSTVTFEYGILIGAIASILTIISGFVVLNRRVSPSRIPLLLNLSTFGAYTHITPAQTLAFNVKWMHFARFSCRNLGINVPCLMGAIIGLIALFLDWFVHSYNPIYLFEPLIISSSFQDTHYMRPIIIFAVGVIITFYSPLGSVLQGAGLLMFIEEFRSGFIYWGIPTYSLLSIGFTLAIMSFILVTSSFIFPYGLSPRGQKLGFLDRLFVWRHTDRTEPAPSFRGGKE